MSFLLLMAAAGAMSWLASFVLGRPVNLRDAMRGAPRAFFCSLGLIISLARTRATFR